MPKPKRRTRRPGRQPDPDDTQFVAMHVADLIASAGPAGEGLAIEILETGPDGATRSISDPASGDAP
jgi:hypothetical protein